MKWSLSLQPGVQDGGFIVVLWGPALGIQGFPWVQGLGLSARVSELVFKFKLLGCG